MTYFTFVPYYIPRIMSTEFPAAFAKAAWAVATAAVLGAGSTVISTKIENVRQDEQLRQHEVSLQKVEKLNDKLDETNRNIAVLNERLRRE